MRSLFRGNIYIQTKLKLRVSYIVILQLINKRKLVYNSFSFTLSD